MRKTVFNIISIVIISGIVSDFAVGQSGYSGSSDPYYRPSSAGAMGNNSGYSAPQTQTVLPQNYATTPTATGNPTVPATPIPTNGFQPAGTPNYNSAAPVNPGQNPVATVPAAVPATVPAAPAMRPPVPVNAPFQLTPQQQQQVDRVLAFWENYTKGIKKFESEFDLYTYPAVSMGGEDVNSPAKVQTTSGFLKYEAPNKGIFRIDGPPKELHRCNGKSVFSYNFDKKEINEYKFNDEEGKELNKGPMAFLFGASAATLRDRYWIRLIAPPEGAPKGQIWMEAYPKYQEDLQDMTKAELIINVQPCQPVAFQRHSPNGDRQSYHLKNVKVNKFALFDREPFEPNERGWTIVLSSQQ